MTSQSFRKQWLLWYFQVYWEPTMWWRPYIHHYAVSTLHVCTNGILTDAQWANFRLLPQTLHLLKGELSFPHCIGMAYIVDTILNINAGHFFNVSKYMYLCFQLQEITILLKRCILMYFWSYFLLNVKWFPAPKTIQ